MVRRSTDIASLSSVGCRSFSQAFDVGDQVGAHLHLRARPKDLGDLLQRMRRGRRAVALLLLPARARHRWRCEKEAIARAVADQSADAIAIEPRSEARSPVRI